MWVSQSSILHQAIISSFFWSKLVSSTWTPIALTAISLLHGKYVGEYSLNFPLQKLPKWIKVILLKRASGALIKTLSDYTDHFGRVPGSTWLLSP